MGYDINIGDFFSLLNSVYDEFVLFNDENTNIVIVIRNAHA